MEKFEIDCREQKNYEQRSRSSLIISLIISGIASIPIALRFDWIDGLLVGAILLAVQIFSYSRRNKYYILSIVIYGKEIEITYTDVNEKKSIKDRIELFELKKKRDQFKRGRSFYMHIYYQKKLLIKQRDIGDWNEKTFDEVVDAFSERK